MVPGKTLQHQALAEIAIEPSVNAAHIGIAAIGRQHEVAERVARSVPGISAVDHRLVIEPQP